MIFFDVTKVLRQKHRSGLVRVSERLRAELSACPGVSLVPVVWHARKGTWFRADAREPAQVGGDDWLLTPELFSEEERPGFGAWLACHGARAAAIFHDAIPLRLPEITWPQSVARHPGYMRLLADFGCVFAVSEASGRELVDYWRWAGLSNLPTVTAITLGADGHGAPRIAGPVNRAKAHGAVMVGIVEPRKNQDAVLDAIATLAAKGLEADVAFIGRVNPHFGRPIARRMKDLAKAGRRIVHHESLDDAGVAALVASARFSLLPSRAEGCGLPVLESLWAGLPVLASALPSIEESATGGGCLLVPPGNVGALVEGMRRMYRDDSLIGGLEVEACARRLPTWRETALAVLERFTASQRRG